MWNLLRRWLGSLVSHASRFTLRLVGRPLGRWVEGSYTESHHRLLYLLLPQSKRHYYVYLPRRYSVTRASPLVVMLHGCKQDAALFSSGTRMNELADEEGFLVLYPEQRRLSNAQRCWNWFDSSAQRAGGEAALIAGMIREVTRTHAVDPDRVYIAGLSAGGAMASIMATCYGDIFAACAVHSGLMYGAAGSVSEAVRAMKQGSRVSPADAARQAVTQKEFAFVPVMVIHGAADSVVNPANADQVIEQVKAMSMLADSESAAVTESTRTQTGGGRYGYALHDYHRGDMLFLRKVLVEGLDHAWSGGNGEHPFNDPKGPDASRMIWEFLSGFQRAGQKAEATAIAQ